MNETHEVVAASPTAIDRGMLPVADVVARVRRIQEIMTVLMKEGVHYGKIPGTDKPTLYQPGAEMLCTTFRIAPSPEPVDLSTPDVVRYRVIMRGANQATGEALGEGVGECSSNEEKYRWRRPVCDEEFSETAEDCRREKWTKKRDGGAFKAKQVRTSPPDIANTVLKMAYKRALISMTRVVLACSDIFNQDLEDLPEEVRDSVIEGEATDQKPPIQPPRQKTNGKAKADPNALTVVAIDKKTGETDGRAWAFFVVKFSDGKEGSTFNGDVAQAAEKLRGGKTPVERVLTENPKKPGKFNLTEIAPMTGSDDAD